MQYRQFIRRSTLQLLVVVATGAVVLAQAPPPSATPSQPAEAAPKTRKYVIHLQGGDLPANAARVLRMLSQRKLVPLGDTTLEDKSSLCSIYIDKTNFPGSCTQSLVDLATDVNGFKTSPQRLSTGTPVFYPGVEFEKYDYEKQYDLKNPGDRASLETDKKISGPYMSVKPATHGKFVEHTFEGYKLTVDLPADAASKKTLEQLQSYQGIYVAEAPPRDGARTRTPQHSVTTAAQMVPSWCNGPDSEERPYARWLGVNAVETGDCGSGRCADVVLIDQPISPHPEIAPALEGWVAPTPSAPATPPPSVRCDAPSQLGDTFHGTHLAGIIASQKNGFAFAGLHPGARLFSRSWPDLGESGVAGEIHNRRNRDGLQIYVFASQWVLGDTFARGDRLKKADYRLKPIVAQTISERNADLWVVAAGQPGLKGDEPIEIDSKLNRGPMNLGDLRNVLVVAGCDPCAPAPALWPTGNFSRTFVHLAAPADLIVSTATADSFTWAQGTSQATAFVAGVASAMVSAWPNTYKDAERVKERLQYTATPFPSAADRERIAAGVVNPTSALF